MQRRGDRDRSPDAALSSPFQAIVLAMTIQRPSYGYEIVNRFNGLFGSFLNINYSSVYDTLKRLSRLGLVEELDREPGGGKPSMRRPYRATASGARAYRRWVGSRIDDETERAGMLGRIATAGRLGPAALHRVLDNCEEMCAQRAEGLACIETLDASHPSLEALCDRLVIAERRTSLRGLCEWILAAREEVEAYERRSRWLDAERAEVRCGRSETISSSGGEAHSAQRRTARCADGLRR